jgi:hypothetical protein
LRTTPHLLVQFDSTRLIQIRSHWGQSETCDPDHALAYEVNRGRYREMRLTLSARGPFCTRDAWRRAKRTVGRHGFLCISALGASALSQDQRQDAMAQRKTKSTVFFASLRLGDRAFFFLCGERLRLLHGLLTEPHIAVEGASPCPGPAHRDAPATVDMR